VTGEGVEEDLKDPRGGFLDQGNGSETPSRGKKEDFLQATELTKKKDAG